ncbi:hypothetical protein Leryth_025441 [Lithospermum erythrorhizon]|nr:hypothetical protein Leryth_025441 [Lithospermum erythrorhizon]
MKKGMSYGAKALLDGLIFCCEKLAPFFVETDSNALKDMIDCKVTVHHIYIEKNMVADNLANLALDRNKDEDFISTANSTCHLKALIERKRM